MFWNRAEIAICEVETFSQSRVVALLYMPTLLHPVFQRNNSDLVTLFTIIMYKSLLSVPHEWPALGGLASLYVYACHI